MLTLTPPTLTPQIRDLGSGNFGVAKLMRDRRTNELVAVKFIERGQKARPGIAWICMQYK